MAPSPLAPITIRSACCLEATFMISFSRLPKLTHRLGRKSRLDQLPHAGPSLF